MNPLHELQNLGQSIWLDFITREFIAQGKLAKLIKEDGLRGVTSNPTIFQKAISGSPDYDRSIAKAQREGKSASAIFEALAVEDIQQACDAFAGVYRDTQGTDGYVSLEVNPHLARHTQGTLQEARHLFKVVNRPNVMIKIPGTKEGLGAIEQALGEGININVTLIFSNQRYQEVMEAWLKGLERLDKSGKKLSRVASVASFFVSRVDSLIDKELEKKSGSENLMGKAAIANAVLAYDLFEKMRNGARFKALEAKGALVQRPLWASTSTKNPKYRDVLYVEELIGKDTVDTLPLATVDAFRDHGNPKRSLPGNIVEAKAVFENLATIGIRIDEVTQKLEVDGLKLFAESYDDLLKSLEQKKEALRV